MYYDEKFGKESTWPREPRAVRHELEEADEKELPAVAGEEEPQQRDWRRLVRSRRRLQLLQLLPRAPHLGRHRVRGERLGQVEHVVRLLQPTLARLLYQGVHPLEEQLVQKPDSGLFLGHAKVVWIIFFLNIHMKTLKLLNDYTNPHESPRSWSC